MQICWVNPLLKTLQWLIIALRNKTKTHRTIFKWTHSNTPLHSCPSVSTLAISKAASISSTVCNLPFLLVLVHMSFSSWNSLSSPSLPLPNTCFFKRHLFKKHFLQESFSTPPTLATKIPFSQNFILSCVVRSPFPFSTVSIPSTYKCGYYSNLIITKQTLITSLDLLLPPAITLFFYSIFRAVVFNCEWLSLSPFPGDNWQYL